MFRAEPKAWEGARTAPSPVAAAGESGNRIRFEDVSVTYGSLTVLADFTLTVEPGEIVALLGPSGSGKTTALRAVAGFVRPSRGRVYIGDTDVTDQAPHARNIGMVVQNYALFPHMTAAENVAFGLKARGADRALIAERVESSLAMVGMGSYVKRMPRQLSGGQQQRVAIARALAIRPRVLLLDEPLSALDAQIRRQMVEELARLHRELPHLTVLYVTHDQSEALTLADRIAIMRDGRLAAFDAARDLYRRPPNRFTAAFLGRANVISGTVTALSDDGRTVEVTVEGAGIRGTAHGRLEVGAPALVCVRPHDLKAEPSNEHRNRLDGRVTFVDWQGEIEMLTIEMDGCEFRVAAPPSRSTPRAGDSLSVFFSEEDTTVLPHEPDHG
jgi:2-aminoethylphosphonate transport system ATP-binding protein